MEKNANSYGPLALAFLGDAVFGLLVREALVSKTNLPTGELHRLSVQSVNAGAQARAAKELFPLLSPEEAGIFRRGRNAHPGHTPKNQNEGDYHYATGLEALFGWFYLRGETARLRELFDKIFREDGTDASL